MKQNIVTEWYKDQKNVNEMIHWNQGKLKLWEKKVLDYFPAGAKILDVGCGLGREAFALNERGYVVTGIDISLTIIEQVKKLAKENKYDIDFLYYDGKLLPFNDNSFDVVLIWAQTFGLMYGNNYKLSYLKECKRVLKNSGILSFSGHDYEFLMENYIQLLDGKKFYPYANSEIYWEAFLPKELEAFAQNSGFKLLLCERGEIYQKEDGTILHCLCKKKLTS